jgi:hypothetical protein
VIDDSNADADWGIGDWNGIDQSSIINQIVNRQSTIPRIGNRQSATGNRQSAIGNRQ